MANLGSKKKVIVIGGGVAGLTAAITLIKDGNFDVTLLEADNRLGGRVQTIPLGGKHFIENGAQWVHGNVNNSIFRKAEPLGLLDTTGNYLKFDAHSVFVNQKGKVIPKELKEKLRNVLMKVSNGPLKNNSDPHQSLGNWAEGIFWDHEIAQDLKGDDKLVAAQVLDWQHRFQTGIDGSDNWNTPSCRGQQEYWECEGNPLNAWKSPSGYSTLLNLILYNKPLSAPQFMPEIPTWIHLEKEVVTIDYSSEKEGKIQCKDGSEYFCDHVICTVSLGILKEKHETLFVPPLPEQKVKAIKHLAIGCVNKLHFDFSSKWWPDDIIGFNLLWDLQDPVVHYSSNVSDDALLTEVDDFPLWCRGILGFYTVASHPHALNSWMTGPTARLIEKLDEDLVKSTFMKVLRQFVGSTYNLIPDPAHFVRSTWFSNPFIRGSYSFRSVDSEDNNVWSTDISSPILCNNSPVLCFAGEASHIHFYSTVHGAHDSGLREAERLINFVTNKGSLKEIPHLYPYTEEMFKEEEEDE